ncbi:MAG TPA: hypothetical protein VGM41_13685, partial [Chitinophagaceae bacterium]
MPSKKSLILSLLFVLAGMAGIAQSPRIIYSEPERDDSRRTNFEIIGKLNGNFLVYKSNRSDDAVCVYDNDMKLKDRVKLEFTPDQVINVDFVAYPDFFYMFYSYQKKGVVHCAVAKLDGNAHKMMEPVELDTTQIGWGNGNKIYTMLNSDDKKRIMVFKINSKNQKNFVFTTLLYNSNLELLGKHRMNMPMEERNDFFTDFLLSNDGNLVFGKCLRENYNEYITRLMLVIKYPDSTDFSINNVETGNRILDEVKIKVDNSNKRILVNAFYYKQKRGNIEGLYSVLWDQAQNRKIKEFASVFNDDLRNSAKSSDGSTKMAFNDFFIKNIIIRKDGGYLLVCESEYTTSRGGGFNRWDYLGGGNPWVNPMDYSYWSPYGSWNSPWNRWNTNSITRYHAENIMMLSYSSDGAIEWSNVIPKSQFDDESDNMVSYQLMNTGVDVHFLFNAFERRVLMLNDQSLDAEG